jgi:predicted nucleic-acid-binding protein
MIGLDTNVLVRYLTLDDARQTPLAVDLLDSLSADSPGFISLIVVVELVWVLETSYDFGKDRIIETLDALLRSHELAVERADAVRQALRRFATCRAGFADCLIERCCHEAECRYTVTFDKKAVGAGMRVITG